MVVLSGMETLNIMFMVTIMMIGSLRSCRAQRHVKNGVKISKNVRCLYMEQRTLVIRFNYSRVVKSLWKAFGLNKVFVI